MLHENSKRDSLSMEYELPSKKEKMDEDSCGDGEFLAQICKGLCPEDYKISQ